MDRRGTNKDDDLFEKWRPNSKWFEYGQVARDDTDAKSRLIRNVLAAKYLFDIVGQYIDDQVSDLESTEESLSDFDASSWAEKQAFRNGQRAAYKRIKKFLP